MMKHQLPIAIALSPPPTRAQWETRDPVWYETKRLTSWVPLEKLELAADVVLGVWDKDVGYDPDFVGTVRLPMQDLTRKGDDGQLFVVQEGARLGAHLDGQGVTENNWIKLQDRAGQGGGGELLVVHQLVPYDEVLIVDSDDDLQRLPNIELREMTPEQEREMQRELTKEQEKFELRLLVLGLRGLRLLSWTKVIPAWPRRTAPTPPTRRGTPPPITNCTASYNQMHRLLSSNAPPPAA